ncbi:hypothetical protein HJG60_011341 [Phyllostomus discolor]|uniref:Uncharacterized protein n=1 Tax=Phyllostomus discolor TaxID=89673 RepID=A0A833ZXK2_9CHIR|nr:hypothetical protein HJG60_011341 [Phyllostomus discolor]
MWFGAKSPCGEFWSFSPTSRQVSWSFIPILSLAEGCPLWGRGRVTVKTQMLAGLCMHGGRGSSRPKSGLWARSPLLAIRSWGGEGHGNGKRELRALAGHLQSRSQFYHCLPHKAAEIQKGKSNSAPVTKR